jgi:hypothetical protein
MTDTTMRTRDSAATAVATIDPPEVKVFVDTANQSQSGRPPLGQIEFDLP